MSSETQSAVAQELHSLQTSQRRPFSIVLHGGEPLLLGKAGLEGLLSKLRDQVGFDCGVSIQTNGVLITEAILDVCVAHEVSLSVSLDGPANVHDRFRVDRVGRATHDKVVAGIAALKAHRSSEALFSGVLAVVDPMASPDVVYDYFRDLGVPSVDFLYRDGNHSVLPFGKSAPSSTEYGIWISRILDRYVADPAPFRIRMLDDMMKLALGGVGVKEGVGLTDFGILIIDTDGSVKKNDTLKSSPPGDGFEAAWNVHTHSLSEIAASDEFQDYHRAQRPSSAICRKCSLLQICGGGMVTHRFAEATGYDNPTVFCADQTMLIRRIHDHISRFSWVSAA